MRNSTAVSVTLAAMLLFSGGAVGQQDQLLVDLSAEPRRVAIPATLYQAASANDFHSFDALYRSAPEAEYAELHRLWSWSMDDRIGAFYGAEEYERLASLYSGYAAYIENYRIVDSAGNVFYPSAETRRFLLREAVAGVVVPLEQPRVLVARAETVAPVRTPAPQRAPEAVAGVVVPFEQPRVLVARAETVAPVRTPAPQRPPETVVSAPVVVAEVPPVVVLEQAVEAAPLIESAPVIVPAVPLAVVADAEPVRGVVGRNEANRGALSRSILLMIAGLLAVGMITLMLQTPREEGAPRPTR